MIIYRIKDIDSASKILPWIIEHNWEGVVWGKYDKPTIHYGVECNEKVTNQPNVYQIFNRDGGVIVASVDDYYILSFAHYADEHVIINDFVSWLIQTEDKIKFDNNDLVIGGNKIAGCVAGSYKDHTFYGWHFSTESVDTLLIAKLCDKNTNKTPSCFRYRGLNFTELFMNFIRDNNVVCEDWSIDVNDCYKTTNITLPESPTKTSWTIKKEGECE